MTTPTFIVEEEIKRIAYGLWEQDGRPAGVDQEHYFRAEELYAETHTELADPKPKKAATRKRATAKTTRASSSTKRTAAKKTTAKKKS